MTPPTKKSDIEVKTERTDGFFLEGGKPWEGIRVHWRRVGNRRWQKFLLVADPNQPLEELEEHAEEAALHVAGEPA